MKTLKRTSVACLTLFPVLSAGQAHMTELKPRPSMKYACKASSFLSVSVCAPKRDSIPLTQINLRDQHSREQGVNVRGARIPRSTYADVVEIPNKAGSSRTHAIEICGADQGKYTLTVYEHGDELYRIVVRGNTSSLEVILHSREGRVRQHRYLFRMNGDDESDLTWLDKNGKPELNIEDHDW